MDTHEHGIAIVGMAGRFPGATDLDRFWRNLCAGVESITFFTDNELLVSGLDPALVRDPDYIHAGGILSDIEGFDAPFFGFSPREAEILDPQQRVFLECAWQAMESAGYVPGTQGARVGVYAGATTSTYLLANLLANPDVMAATDPLQIRLGNDKDFLATRVSYKLGLTGPSIVIQTACSTSLVAIHCACQGLLSGECDMALAGGVSLSVPHRSGYLYRRGGILSPDGHCRAFDADAQGTVPGNGVGVVVLRRLTDALTAGDHIRAVILGSAINNDGWEKVGYSAPSVRGQAEAISEALEMAQIGPETISYVEAHGTGTPLGDPIEAAALIQAFRSTAMHRRCPIGSVKTNIGHLDAAAGVAGLIKAVLALEHHQIPASLHYKSPNPEIDFANSPFYVNTSLASWQHGDVPRRAGVSSFGMGGTNAHVVLEEAPISRPGEVCADAGHLFVLAAKTSAALDDATSNLATYLASHGDANPADVAYTLQVGRTAFTHRRAFVARSSAEAATALRTKDPTQVIDSDDECRERSVVMMFPGQGTQYINMARGLYEGLSEFRTHVDRCLQILTPLLGTDLREVLYPRSAPVEATRLLTQTSFAQPALFVVEYALAQLWIERGVRPTALIGHSIGEYVAACLSGVFTLKDALKLVAIRGRLMQDCPVGAMTSVALDEAALRPLLAPSLSIAAINSPAMMVVAGPEGDITELEHTLPDHTITYKRLRTSHAFHSSMMDPVVETFAQHVSQIARRAPSIPFVSNVTGTWIDRNDATDPQYWAQHLRRTVRFADGLREIQRTSDRILLEVGPGRTLGSFARQHPDTLPDCVILNSLPPFGDRASDEIVCFLRTLGELWLSGAPVEWAHTSRKHSRLPLPTYPFERHRYWIAPRRAEAHLTDVRASGYPPPGPVADVLPESSLTLHERPRIRTSYVAPSTDLEDMLADLWRELLGVGSIGTLDNFFELGGDSLTALRLQSRLQERLSVDVPLPSLFDFPTIADLADVIEGTLFAHLGEMPESVVRRYLLADSRPISVIGPPNEGDTSTWKGNR